MKRSWAFVDKEKIFNKKKKAEKNKITFML
jgi:hypothetical protein